MMPGADHLMQVCEATWPPARRFDLGPFTLRDGAGGGKRVSAATLAPGGTATEADRHQAEAAMREIGQAPLFQIRPGEDAFDASLAAAGYEIIDPVQLYVIPAEALADVAIPRVTTFCIWEPLAIMIDLWAEAGIDADRIAVMQRAACAKTGLLGRIEDNPAATAYVGLHDGTAMVHALEVTPDKRRKGMAQWMMRAAAQWTRAQGGSHLSVLCVKENAAANALYRAMGFAPAGSYHYRIKQP
ncbi:MULTISPECIES: GNAT family N-acetyltransferase [unclassified Marinovum]